MPNNCRAKSHARPAPSALPARKVHENSCSVGSGTITAFVALLYVARQWAHPALAFTAFGIAFIVARLRFGELPDRIGGARVTGHGMDLSSSPPTAALEPRVAIMQNGSLKGGDADVIRTVEAYPGLQGFWRTHDTSRYPALNGDADFIANRDGAPDAGNPILLDITPAGAITVTNTRNGFRKTYTARAASR